MIIYSLINWQIEKENKWFILSVLFCGFALSTKYNGAILLLLPCLFLIADIVKNKQSLTAYIKLLSISAIYYIVSGSSWLVVNYFYTGNPLSPFFTNIFHDRVVNKEMADGIKHFFKIANVGFFTNIKNIFCGTPILFFILFLKRWTDITSVCVIICSIFYFIIIACTVSTGGRLYVPLFVMLFFIIAVAVFDLTKSQSSTKRTFFLSLFVIMIGYNVYTVFHEIFRKDNFPYITNKETKDNFLIRMVGPEYAVALWANQNVAFNEKILADCITGVYYFDSHVITPNIILSRYAQFSNSNDENYIISQLKEKNMPYVITYRDSWHPEMLKKYFDNVFHSGDYFVYKLKE
jgi:hypothetical protein